MFHKSKSSLISTFVFVIGLTVCASTSCELPADLTSSTWTYTRPTIPPSNITFGHRILTDFVVNVYGGDYSAFTCQLHKTLSSTKTILLFRSDSSFYDPGPGISKRIYLCMKMTKVSSNLFYFFLLNDHLPASNPQERASAHQDSVISDNTLENTFCQYDANNPPDDVRILQREGTSEVLPSGITLCEPFTNTCETGSAITCDDIETVQFSTNITTGNSVNDTISFNCTTGYEITVGESELTCSDNGTWYGTPPKCTIIMCPDLSGISHATSSPASPTHLFNETVTYTCNVGYEHTSGDLSRTCQEDKQWSGNPPSCTIISCPALADVSHSSRNPTTPSNTYDETVTYTCNTGYEKTSGDLSRKCRADKTWSGSAPVCTIVSCPSLSGVSHSSRDPASPTNTYDKTVTYTCNTGYEKTSGALSRKCRADKTWSGSEPVCSIISCPALADVSHSSRNPTSPSNTYDETVTYTCNTGYEKTSGDLSRKCRADKTWSGSAPVCTIVSCPALSDVSHSSRVPGSITNTYDETVTYTCNTGYEKTLGDLSRKCRADKTWSGSAPVCTIISCPSLSEVLHSSKVPVLPTNTYDETVTYTCSTGYEKTSGDLSRKCRADKTWSGSVPVCTIVSCPTLAVVPNSVSNSPVPGNNYGAEISYTCISGYEGKEGTLVRKCQATKQWSGSAPVCGKISCGVLPNVPHSTVNPNPPNTEYQSSVTYTCSTGYERASGDLTRQCQTNRQWSGVSPVCNRINCGILPLVPSVSLTKTGTLYLDTVTYTCLPGYLHINGSLTRKCQADRTWDGIPPYCALLPTTPDAQTNAYVAGAVAVGSLFLIPIVVVLLLCYLRGKICKKSNAQTYNQHEWKERNQTGSSNNSYDGNYGYRGRHWLPHGHRVAYPYFSQYRY